LFLVRYWEQWRRVAWKGRTKGNFSFSGSQNFKLQPTDTQQQQQWPTFQRQNLKKVLSCESSELHL
jgi:hypothetical protein